MGQVGVALPARQQLAGLVEHPAPQGQDQPGFFGQADEFGWRHQAALRVLPAHQRLHAHYAAGAVALRLVLQQELILGEGGAQVAFQRGAARHGGLHVGVEKAQRAAPGRLGLVHGQVGLLQQLAHAGASVVERGDANAGRAAVLVASQQVGGREQLQNLFAHRARRACQLRGLAAELFDHHHELVAAQARHGVDAAHAAAQALCHVLQQQVAHVMAQGVVQGLEVVQVDEQQRTALALALGAGQCLLHAVHQQHAVGQSGERVVEGQALHLALAGLARADVGVDLQDRRRLSVLARNPRPVCFHVERVAVAVVLGDLAHPLALLQCGVRGAREHCGVVVQQRLRALAQRLQPGPAVEALGALVPEQDAVRQVAHDDGVLRLVQQRGLVADARLGLLALNLGCGARGEDLQHRGDEPSLVQRFAEQHEDQAQRLAVGVAQLLADVALGAEFAQHGRGGVAPGHVALHHELALR